jgi:hypothetical protein
LRERDSCASFSRGPDAVRDADIEAMAACARI